MGAHGSPSSLAERSERKQPSFSNGKTYSQERGYSRAQRTASISSLFGYTVGEYVCYLFNIEGRILQQDMLGFRALQSRAVLGLGDLAAVGDLWLFPVVMAMYECEGYSWRDAVQPTEDGILKKTSLRTCTLSAGSGLFASISHQTDLCKALSTTPGAWLTRLPLPGESVR